jgi:hypothetical protein
MRYLKIELRECHEESICEADEKSADVETSQVGCAHHDCV